MRRSMGMRRVPYPTPNATVASRMVVGDAALLGLATRVFISLFVSSLLGYVINATSTESKKKEVSVGAYLPEKEGVNDKTFRYVMEGVPLNKL